MTLAMLIGSLFAGWAGAATGGYAGTAIRSRFEAGRNIQYRARLIRARGRTGSGAGLPYTKYSGRTQAKTCPTCPT